MKLYWINIRTLEVFEDKEGLVPQFFEVGFMALHINHCIERYIDWVEEKKMMHKTFNTTAKKDIFKFIQGVNNKETNKAVKENPTSVKFILDKQ